MGRQRVNLLNAVVSSKNDIEAGEQIEKESDLLQSFVSSSRNNKQRTLALVDRMGKSMRLLVAKDPDECIDSSPNKRKHKRKESKAQEEQKVAEKSHKKKKKKKKREKERRDSHGENESDMDGSESSSDESDDCSQSKVLLTMDAEDETTGEAQKVPERSQKDKKKPK